jgi:transposase
MRKKVKRDENPKNAESIVRGIDRRTRRTFTSEEKIRIVLEGIRGEESIASLCRKNGIHENLYYKWSKDFLEAGRRRLSGDTSRQANSDEVSSLKNENDELKKVVAELTLENRAIKKSLNGLI